MLSLKFSQCPDFSHSDAIEDLRTAHFEVAVVAVDAAHVLLDLLPDRPALRVPEHHPGRFVLQVEKVELPAELAVVALLRFLDPMQVGVEIFLPGPRGAVDSLQHFVARIAAPVRAGQLHQLEDLEPAGRRHVRTAAQVDELAFGVERNRLVGRDRRDDLRLVVLADRLEIAHRLVARHQRAGDRLVLLRELDHLVFDRLEIFGRERPLEREVVVEAVLDHRSDRHLRIGEQFLDRVGEQMRGRVTDDVETLGVALGDDRDSGVLLDHMRCIDDLAVDLAGERCLGKSGADRRGELCNGHRRVEMLDGAVGQSDVGHGRSFSGSDTHFSLRSDGTTTGVSGNWCLIPLLGWRDRTPISRRVLRCWSRFTAKWVSDPRQKKCGGAALFSEADDCVRTSGYRVVITPVLHAFAVS